MQTVLRSQQCLIIYTALFNFLICFNTTYLLQPSDVGRETLPSLFTKAESEFKHDVLVEGRIEAVAPPFLNSCVSSEQSEER